MFSTISLFKRKIQFSSIVCFVRIKGWLGFSHYKKKFKFCVTACKIRDKRFALSYLHFNELLLLLLTMVTEKEKLVSLLSFVCKRVWSLAIRKIHNNFKARLYHEIHTYVYTHHIIKNPLIQTLPYTEVGSRRVWWKTNFFFRFSVWKIASFLAHQCISVKML